MSASLNVSNYFCHVIGESPEKAARFHASTIRRTKAFAIAIHIPVVLWAVTGLVIATQIFHLHMAEAMGVAVLCAALIYMVERLVLATPKVWSVNLVRVFIGLVISILGATTVDLVIFDREITEQLRSAAEVKLLAEHDGGIEELEKALAQQKQDWQKAQEAANCEANGTCGSKLRSVGPVYRELARQAEFHRVGYTDAQAKLTAAREAKANALTQWRGTPPDTHAAGILARVQALHEYTTQHTAAMVAWVLLFSLVLFLELTVVLSKLTFGQTVDDELEVIRERISQQKAREYMEAMTYPATQARSMIAASFD